MTNNKPIRRLAAAMLGLALASASSECWGQYSQVRVPSPQTSVVARGTDAAAIQRAIDTGATRIVLPPGQYTNTSTTITLDTAGATLIADGAEIVAAENWVNAPLLVITGDRATVQGLTITETNASAINASKNGSSNAGISIEADFVTLDRVKVKGFGFPLLVRGTAADYENATIQDSEFSHGYNWCEIDSVTSCTLRNIWAHSHGLDGIKVQSEHSRTCEGLQVFGGELNNNGLRDTAAGGAESTNGNGIDLYHGGWRFAVVGLYAHDNYGSGFNIKGDASTSPVMGEGSIVACQSHNNKSTSGGTSHGFEFNNGGDTGGSLITLTNCHGSGNTGKGLTFLGGYSLTINSGSFTGNGTGGIQLLGFDVAVNVASVLGNTGIGIEIGSADSGAFTSRRAKLRDCIVSGLYDTDLATGSGPRASAGTKVTTQGIRVRSDSSDVSISGGEVRHCTNAGLWSSGLRVSADNITLYGNPGGTIQVNGGSLSLRLVTIDDVDFTVNGSLGAIIVAAATLDATQLTFTQSSSTTSRPMRLNNAAAILNLGSYSTNNYTAPTVLISSGSLRRNEILQGSGTPESVVTAPVGSLFLRLDGGAATSLYIKESGTGNTGWVAK